MQNFRWEDSMTWVTEWINYYIQNQYQHKKAKPYITQWNKYQINSSHAYLSIYQVARLV